MGRHKRVRIERAIFKEERPRGVRLVVRMVIDGTDRSSTLPDGATIGDARRERDRMEARFRPVAPNAPTTLRDYALRWIEAKGASVKRSTAEHYIDVIAHRLLSAVIEHEGRPVCMGDIPAAQIARPHAIAWVEWASAQQSKRGQQYAHATLDSWWRPVRCLLADMSADLNTPDPTRRVRGPRSSVRNVREGRTLTAEQLGKLIDIVERKAPTWAAEVLALALLGLRPGELYEMRWSDIDDARGVVLLTRAHWLGTTDTTKTGAGRALAIAPRLRKALAAHRWRMTQEGRPVGPEDLIFPARHGRNRGPEAMYQKLRALAGEAGIPFKVGNQTLRRTFNTLAVELGASPIVVRSQMGHSSVRMTHRYAGVHDEAKAAVVAQLEGAIE
jgi:integrase